MQNISIILVTLTTFTTRGQTENEKMGSDMSISSEVPEQGDVVLPWKSAHPRMHYRVGKHEKHHPENK